MEPKQKSNLLRLFRRDSLIKGQQESAIKGTNLMDLYLVGNTRPIERSVLKNYPLLGEGRNAAREILLSMYQESLLTKLNNSVSSLLSYVFCGC